MAVRGFIVERTYRVESDRAVVRLYGRLERGRAFLVRDDRASPYFWIRRAEARRAGPVGADVADPVPPYRTLDGEPAVRVTARRPQDVPVLRNRLESAGVATFEADVPFASRYLIDLGLRSSIEIAGSRRTEGVLDVFDNPSLLPAEWSPRLVVLSIDIETDPRAGRLLSCALAWGDRSEVLLLCPPGATRPPAAVAFDTEAGLLDGIGRRIRAIDPDVITGWNVVDFDLAVLARLAVERGVRLDLGRSPATLRVARSSAGRGVARALVPGRAVLDGIDLLRGAFVRLESYALDAAARAILGRGKTITGAHRADEILEAFESDRGRLVEYNRNDAVLVLEILDRLGLIELTIERSLLTGMPLERVGASIASFDFLYLSELGRRRVVAPTVRPAEGVEAVSTGGHVLDPAPGLYRNVLVFDFRSLYPSIIRTFQIDPLGRLRDDDAGPDPIVAPNGARFRREGAILPDMLDALFPRRQAARAAGNRVASRAIKILMNSFYGVLGTSVCRFASPWLANAITGFGRELLLFTKSCVERRGLRVLYGDTDSLFVESGCDDPDAAHVAGRAMAAELNDEIAAHVRRTWRVDSRLELELEQVYLRLLLPVIRHGTAGARKRYAGLVRDDGEERVVYVGLEAVRRDWTDLARRVQRGLYERLFHDRPVDVYLRRVVADVRRGAVDDQLVYRKRLRRRLDTYRASAPPHVVAARKMRSRPRRTVAYVVTEEGPEPASETTAPIDREHYVQRQVRPVAEPVLTLLGLDFDRVVGDDRQGTLF